MDLVYNTSLNNVIKFSGNKSNDLFGRSVSINDIGDTIVIGADNADNQRGYVKVYKLISGTWTQQGDRLTGISDKDNFGRSVSINDIGDTIAIGADNADNQRGYVKVYKFISGTWTLQGDVIKGETTYEYFGRSVSINGIGDTVAIGAWYADNATGYVKVYKLISGLWIQQVKINGEVSSDAFGYSVSINNLGDTVAIGAFSALGGTGYSKVYKLISGRWTQQGAKITGEAIDNSFGWSLDINSVGDIVVIEAFYANSRTGYVKVYKLICGKWTQQGDKLTGESNNEYFGISVSINSLGDTVVIGAHGANSATGYVKIYKFISNVWTLQGDKLTGENTNDKFGYSVCINNAGDTLAIGAYGSNSSTGYVKVYT